MEFNKLVSLVLGFIVIVLVLVWVTGRIRNATNPRPLVAVTPTRVPTPTVTGQPKAGWNPFAFLFNKATPTPTITVPSQGTNLGVAVSPAVGTMTGVTSTPMPTVQYINTTKPTVTQAQGVTTNRATPTPAVVAGVSKIPNTGAPTLLLPLAFSSLAGGAFLSRAKAKK